MAPSDSSDPIRATPDPDSDGREMLGMVVDGRYRLDSTLGRGGMGLVFRATHINLRRQVAVKILHPSLAASPDVRNRFEREALAVGKVDHPNCVATYDVGRLQDGSLYLAMELLEGRSLADVLEAEGQLAPGRALHILAHILRGLGSIHAAGLIHRDIKPENIFLIRQGADEDFAKILDFGIAKPMSGELSDDGVRLTQAGMAFGTPIYMAPEQALGNKMDGRADLYAAAVMGYEMLCGQPPFYSDDKLEVMSMHTAKAVPPMRSRLIKRGNPVPSSIERLIVKGLTKKPADRYASAEVFLAKVEEALHTPDGGVTSVNFERPDEETGSRSLLDESGDVDLATDDFIKEQAPTHLAIGDAIDEVLDSTHPLPATTRGAKPSKPQTPPAGEKARLGTKQGPGVSGPRGSSADNDIAVEPPVVAAGAQPLGRARGAGGVGIGIPYTGPSGEPIFGLTPEERLAQVPKKRRWPLYLAILASALGLGVAIALVTAPGGGGGGGGGEKPTPTEKPGDDPKFDPNSPAGRASDALEHGDPNAAVKILDEAKAQIATDADAQLVLGHARAALHQSEASLAAYTEALKHAPSLASNSTLRANLRAMAADKDPDVVMATLDLWIGRTDDPAAKDALLKAAVSQSLERRRAARPVIDRYRFADDVDWVTTFSLDLDQETTCEKRREAVAHLRALNNPKGLPALERAVQKKNLRKNACLVDDAHSAIGALRSLSPTK